jgi:hypothetical protein
MSPAQRQMQADRAKLNAPPTRDECIEILAGAVHASKHFGAPTVVMTRETAARVIELLKEQP